MRRIGQSNAALQMVVLLILVAVILILGYRQYQRTQKSATIITAAKDLKSGAHIGSGDLKVRKIDESNVPNNAVQDPKDAFGKKLVVDIKQGDVVHHHDVLNVIKALDPLAAMVPEGRLLTMMEIKNMTIPTRRLFQGDRIDILAADGRSAAATVVVTDAYLMGYIETTTPPKKTVGRKDLVSELDLASMPNNQDSGSRGLLLALKPEDVLPLAQLNASKSFITLALHNTQTVKDNTMLSVRRPESKKPRTMQLITGSKQQRITFE